MKLQLISKDPELHRLCRGILAGFPGRKLELITPADPGGYGRADINIWDYHPEISYIAGT
jgi:hypothetical protein